MMNTKIKTFHEETFTANDTKKTLGVLYNYSIEDNYKNSILYIYKEGMYIFFNTMIDMFEYLLYGSDKMNRAYMAEEDFDKLFDANSIEGTFLDHLEFVTGS